MGTQPSDRIGEVLFGRTRRAVLALLYGHADEEFYLRQIIRAAGVGQGSMQRELKMLVGSGLVLRRALGRQVYFRANPDSPVYKELRGLLLKTAGVADVLREALAPLAVRIEVAFVYGSIARGEERRASDVDIMVVGEASFAEVSQALGPAQQRLGREVNPTVYSPAEYKKKLAAGHHFLRSVTERDRIFLLGDEHDIRRLGK
ncbi:MAG: nucleotidyltransferase domain-containing protein [candidate division WOR-3 bacterium]|nr:nucleotidyltransferase domain-containing protein [candidate division WOR-3 bacterium]